MDSLTKKLGKALETVTFALERRNKIRYELISIAISESNLILEEYRKAVEDEATVRKGE